ncbi:glycosyltransferase [Aquihabitans sp. McL0605]|uniref:glycosyltransferase n=1 Tax=Aquihabitans sp. McL0605 TaxID=3415671 RepID=UPI003CF19746
MTDGYSVIVPVHGNATTLEELHRRVAAVFEQRDLPFELIFVDDLSPDDSWDVICSIARVDERVIGVRLEANVRQTRAIFAGIEVSTVGPFVMLDADLDDRPEDIGLLLDAHAAGHDLVVARRTRRHRSTLRRAGSAIVNGLISIGGFQVSDLGSSFMLAERPLEHPVRAQLHETGTQLVLPQVVKASANPTWIDVGSSGSRSPSGYGLVTLLVIGCDVAGTWVSPGVVAAGVRTVPVLAAVAIPNGPLRRVRRWALVLAVAATAVAEVVHRVGTHPSDRLYTIVDQVGGPGAAARR